MYNRNFRRSHAEDVAEFLNRDRPLIVAVTGPRQVGKTTLVRQALRQLRADHRIDYWHIAVDDPLQDSPSSARRGMPRDEQWLVELWEAARREARKSEKGFVLALDEVQYVPDWSRLVKGLWDRDQAEGTRLRVVVLGSAPWQMMTGISESLAGRFYPVKVRQWSLAEMEEAFGYTLDEYLFFGGYPRVARESIDRRRDDSAEWRSYILGSILEPTLHRDILKLNRVTKPPLMRQLLELASYYSGQILSYNKMLGQLQDAGNTTTLARYLDLLAYAGLVAGLPKHYRRQGVPSRASSPKLNVLDTALMTAFSGYSFEEARADRSFWGRIVESGAGAHLYNTLAVGMKLRYWRDRQYEVDFVLSQGPRAVGIEVKSGVPSWPPTGLAAFRERFPGVPTLVVVGGKARPSHRARPSHEVSLSDFLRRPAAHWIRWKGEA